MQKVYLKSSKNLLKYAKNLSKIIENRYLEGPGGPWGGPWRHFGPQVWSGDENPRSLDPWEAYFLNCFDFVVDF